MPKQRRSRGNRSTNNNRQANRTQPFYFWCRSITTVDQQSLCKLHSHANGDTSRYAVPTAPQPNRFTPCPHRPTTRERLSGQYSCYFCATSFRSVVGYDNFHCGRQAGNPPPKIRVRAGLGASTAKHRKPRPSSHRPSIRTHSSSNAVI